MATILEKAQTLISANLHAVLDKALQANSLAVLDEYIRQAQDNLEDLEDAAATVGGQVKTLQRKAEEFVKKAEKGDIIVAGAVSQGSSSGRMGRTRMLSSPASRPAITSANN